MTKGDTLNFELLHPHDSINLTGTIIKDGDPINSYYVRTEDGVYRVYRIEFLNLWAGAKVLEVMESPSPKPPPPPTKKQRVVKNFDQAYPQPPPANMIRKVAVALLEKGWKGVDAEMAAVEVCGAYPSSNFEELVGLVDINLKHLKHKDIP